MTGTLLGAFLIAVAASVIGQAALRLCGIKSWSWLAPSVGISVMMTVSVTAIYVPGRVITTALLLAALTIGSMVYAARAGTLRPPAGGVLAGLVVLLFTLVPFASHGYAGTLGVSLNNDMAFHLAQADAYRDPAMERVMNLHPNYPLGPHALVAVVTRAGIRTDEAFAGLTVASAMVLGWTALAAVRRPRWYGHVLVATSAGMPFLVASYYGQGAFKELLQAALVLAWAIALQHRADFWPPLRWVPLALLTAGVLSVYSVLGLAWPFAFVLAWFGGSGLLHFARRGTLRCSWKVLRAEVGPVAIGIATLVLVTIPQAPRMARFVSAAAATNGTGIAKSDIGNLAGPLPVWQVFGVWDNPEFRFPPVDPFTTGLWTALVLGVLTAGTAWWVMRGDWVIPALAATSVVIWLLSARTQSPYVAAKALVIVCPFVMLVALRPIAERRTLLPASYPVVLRWVAGGLVAVMAFKMAGSSWNALRAARVGPDAHQRELRSLRPLLKGGLTLFLGNDDFIRWELGGVPVDAPVIGRQRIATRPEKPWMHGMPLDLDSLDAPVLNRYDWIITPRDAAGSAPPEQLRVERLTRSFVLWRRTATIDPRSVLAEGPAGSALLDCSTAEGAALQRRRGVAAVRSPTVSVAVARVAPGEVREVALPLGRGTWELQTPYTSQHAIEVTVAGLKTTLPANLDRPGTRWPIGIIHVAEAGTVAVRVRVTKTLLTPEYHAADMQSILATPTIAPGLVPLREACGKMVDWYRVSGP